MPYARYPAPPRPAQVICARPPQRPPRALGAPMSHADRWPGWSGCMPDHKAPHVYDRDRLSTSDTHQDGVPVDIVSGEKAKPVAPSKNQTLAGHEHRSKSCSAQQPTRRHLSPAPSAAPAPTRPLVSPASYRL